VTARSRAYRGEADYQRIGELLVETRALTHTYRNWDIVRLDAFRFGRYGHQEISGERTWEVDFHLWETESGKLVGVVHPEARNHIWLEVHPGYRQLEEEMLEWAEQHHAEIRPPHARSWPLDTFVYERDEERAALLAQRGYENLSLDGVDLRRSLEEPIPEPRLPEGYAIRALRREDEADVAALTGVTNLVFRTDFTREGMWVCMGAPTPHAELAVVAPDGTFASFCTIWLDEGNRVGGFEPVGTHPAYRRRGLGRAMMYEALRRLRAWGATAAELGTGYHAPAVHFYKALGFTISDVGGYWQKEF
jgi:mycothiol synthase